MSTETTLRRAAERRRLAEAQVKILELRDPAALTPEEVERLIHELRVHQIELEMQNEELIRTQVELEGMCARYFDLYHLAPVGYLTLSEKGLILEANLHAAALLGLPSGTLVKRPLGRFILAADSDVYYRHTRQLWQTGQPQVCEVRLDPRRKGESSAWVCLEMVLAQDEKEQATVSRVICRDVSERKQAELALAASEERYRLLTKLSPDGISVTDQTGRILACNEQFAAMYGFENSAAAVGRYAQELASQEAFAGLFRAVAAALEKGESVVREIEVDVLRRDGSSFSTEYSIAPVPWPDAPFGVAHLSSIRDITQRKEQAAELERHRLHLEELVAARTAELRAEIAERAAAQAALRQSEAMLAVSQRMARLGSWERDLRTGAYTFSSEMYRIFGLDPQAPGITAESFWNIMHPDEHSQAEAIFKEVVETGKLHDATHRIVRPSGETRLVRAITELIWDAAGQPERVHGTVQDITEQEQTRAALALHIQELSSMQDLGQVVSMARPPEEIIHIYLQRLVNLAGFDLARMFLLREGRLHLAGASSTLTGSAADSSRCGAQNGRTSDVGECLCGLAVQDGKPVYAVDVESDPRVTLEHCHASGLRSLAALPLRSGETIIGALAIGAVAPDAFADRLPFLQTIADLIAVRLQNLLLLQEVRERAAGLEEIVAERTRELQIERDRTHAILETVGESVIVTGLDGQLLFLNPATSALTGHARDEELGQPLWRDWSRQARAEIWPQAQAALRAGQSWHGEINGLRRDGTTYIAALTGTPLYDAEAGAQPIGVVWVQRDITSQKEVERLKDQFVSNVSHELRTPISIIALACDNLETFHDRLDASQRLEIVRDIQAQTHLLDNIVEDTLQIAQIDAGRVPRERGRLDLARLVREEADVLRPFIRTRGQHLSVSAAATVRVLGNEIQLRQVVRNLLDNAMKYTLADGQIFCTCEIRTDASALTSDAAPATAQVWAVFEVRDQGIGIAARDLPHLFERFYRVNNEVQTPGTGLGLPIAQQLVSLHGGWITVASALGQGSTFAVYLPLAGEE